MLLHPPCLSHAEALPVSAFWQCCQSLEKNRIRKLLHLLKQTQSSQVLSSPAGIPYGETHPETWEWLQGVPMLEKRQTGRASLKCLL